MKFSTRSKTASSWYAVCGCFHHHADAALVSWWLAFPLSSLQLGSSHGYNYDAPVRTPTFINLARNFSVNPSKSHLKAKNEVFLTI